jgi:hypothetical protein
MKHLGEIPLEPIAQAVLMQQPSLERPVLWQQALKIAEKLSVKVCRQGVSLGSKEGGHVLRKACDDEN